VRINAASHLSPADVTMFDLAPEAVARIPGDRLPLLQMAAEPKQAQPNIRYDAMLSPRPFDAFLGLIPRAAARRVVDGHPQEFYEPFDHIEPGLPRTLIHVSGSEVLLHDAQLAAGPSLLK
jgi:hypothetical protein